ncbi:aminotransferase class IV [Acetobacter sp. AN02]|uniref:aminotransferase class IV n=1 Tax=Acetobacter sp. AN02 TaxID=2894186 RepID=UPI0024343187|nr:aminotransferase class IV [Acetobacter sp. AN02]MDG6095449.1 aminotransferase class IV [Acetobacter sp. AN02]
MTDVPVWLNDRLLPSSVARIDPADRGFLLGDGLFETMRLSGGRAPEQERHLARLAAGCDVLRLPCPDPAQLREAIAALAGAVSWRDGSIRLTLTRGAGPRGLLPPPSPSPTLLLTSAPAPAHVPGPVSLAVSRYIRDGLSPLSRVKSLNYLPGILARMEAADTGADDALLCTPDGYISEASAATFIALSSDGLMTPPLRDGALPGTSRARLIEAGLCTEVRIPLSSIRNIRSAWLVTSLSVQPVLRAGDCITDVDEASTLQIRSFLFGPAA